MDSIDVYYSPRQVSIPESSSPSPRKPVLVVNDWIETKIPIRIVETTPVTREQIALAHALEYVEGILSCELINGFRGRQRDVADSLPWTCGSLLSAARGALNNGLVTCSPSSGFHHASYRSGYGYCTFNGLMVTALALKAEGKVRRVGILDCDQHYGDGTADIMDRLGIDWIRHVSQEHGYSPIAKSFLANLPVIVRSFTDCDLLIVAADVKLTGYTGQRLIVGTPRKEASGATSKNSGGGVLRCRLNHRTLSFQYRRQQSQAYLAE